MKKKLVLTINREGNFCSIEERPLKKIFLTTANCIINLAISLNWNCVSEGGIDVGKGGIIELVKTELNLSSIIFVPWNKI